MLLHTRVYFLLLSCSSSSSGRLVFIDEDETGEDVPPNETTMITVPLQVSICDVLK